MAILIRELSNELHVTPREVLDKAAQLKIEATTSVSSIEDEDADAIRKAMAKPSKKATGARPVRAAGKKVKAVKSDEQKARPAMKTAAKRIKKTEVAAEEKAAVSKAEEAKVKKAEAKEKEPENKADEKAESPQKEAAPKKEAKAEKKAEPKKETEGEAPKKEAKTSKESKAPKKTVKAVKEDKKEEVKESKEKKSPKSKKSEPKKEEHESLLDIKVVKTAEEVKKEEQEKKAKREKKAAERAAKKKNKMKTHVRVEQNIDRDGGHSRGEDTRRGRKKKKSRRDKFSKFDDYIPGFDSLEKKVKKKHVKNKPEPEPEVEEEPLPVGTKVVNVPITVAGFSEQVGVSIPKVIMTLLKMGIVANQNQNLDELTVSMLAEEMNIQVQIGKVEEEIVEEGIENFEDREKDLKPRPPIITVMGHVDHGKTSLLDAIRETNVTEQESGGITQHIGASEVEINGKKIVFLDTPGHEAFTAMRARGADITDIAILVVAADDSVKPQTIESINHAKAANVPIIVAINKMDKPGANPDKVMADLAEHGVLVEAWGGDVISVPVSAKKREGIVNLLEMIILQSEMLELKANPNRHALGTVIEARLDKSKGPVATLLVTNGTLKAGQNIVAGTSHGHIRLMTNYKGDTIRKADPATAVEILGLDEVPAAGDEFNVVAEGRIAKEIAESRKERQREEIMARTSGSTLEELFSSIKEGEVKELNLIVKADVRGSVGAIVSSLEKLSTENVRVKVIHDGVGAITESDVRLAGTSSAVIIGFNVRPTAAVSNIAEADGVQIRTYRVIYDILDDVENAIKGMLDPEFKEEVLGEVEVRDTFKVPSVGIIAGGYVTNGKIVRNADVRLVRDGIVIHEGKISSLRRFKDDVKDVAQGYECGIGIENYNDIKVGDYIECFHMVEVERED